MPQYKAPIDDFKFLLHEFLQIEQYSELEGFATLSPELINSILTEGGKFCEEVLFPLNQTGDKEGCQLKNGKVRLPAGFKEAYQSYIKSGWTGFTADTTYGGQALPEVMNMPMAEMVCASNLSFSMIPGLSRGAYNALFLHASDALKQRFLPPLVKGNWTGVMSLTEAHCGTDLGLITTKATPNRDKSYNISGSKIFISAGEHDAAENIIHLVLARLPDAPDGIKGISLFVVPRIWVNEDGSLGKANHITCGAIEEKMGIHASPTCVMNYENAKGFLVGEPHKGMRAMFTMMNEARLYVGVQGLGISETAYQNASHYAKDRLQGRALKEAAQPEKKADPLIVHPDVRRMLLTIRSFNEGARALSLYTALQIDLAKHHPDAEIQERADHFVQLMTPIIKAYFTDMGFDNANLAMQIFGGHGYITEYGMEQYVRDARIAQLYEGANGIQALDLVGRKLPQDMGKLLRSFFHPATEFVAANKDDPDMAPFTKVLHQAIGSLQNASMLVATKGLADPNEAAGVSVEYLRLFALTVMGYLWAQMAKTSFEALESGGAEDKAFYQDKINVGKFFMDKILSSHFGYLSTIANGAKTLMKMDADSF